MLPQHFLFLLLPLLPFSSGSIAKPGCPDRCGNFLIPFPFGVGSGCYLAPSFEVLCNTSANPATPLLNIFTDFGNEILELNSSQIRIKYPNLALTDYVNGTQYIVTYDLSYSQFTYSYDNWVTAVGCDDTLAVTGRANRSFAGGCVAYCLSRNDSGGIASCPDDRDALGVGCCRTPIPRGTNYLVINTNDGSSMWRRQRLYRSSFSFVGEKGNSTTQSQFSYRLNDLDESTSLYFNNSWAARNTPPVLFNWRIGDENCNQARRNITTYACKDNTICSDFDVNVGGYLCSCLPGYEGNPYLAPGCTDIDECGESRTNPCYSNAICTNTPGHFSCSCPEGYYGDGRKGGTGCIRMPHSNTLIWIMTGLGSGLGFILFLAMCFWLNKESHKRKKQMRKDKFFKRNGGLLLRQQTNEGAFSKTKVFSSQDLDTATDHFNESRILGKGGQGTVYKGMLSDGKIVAIKKSKMVDDNLLEQFINEVVILSQINHRNVVKLLGCCLETDVPLLVYEFLPNGTLFDLIHDPADADSDARSQVSWSMRLKIATDIAGALAYIHSASSVPIYHRDIKSQNFLLDEKYVVKLADFGISRSIELNQTHLTTMVKGTFGYLDPEYFHSRQYSEKSEVYSFGVVLAELITGKRPIFSESEERIGLAAHFVECAEENRLEEIIDPQILEQYGRKEEVTSAARLAHRCLNSKGKMRPMMKEVATELESLWISQMPPPTIIEQSEESRGYDANSIMFSDMEETWTTTYTTETS
ncbi:hypothetical protein ACS0TY_012714 [Phlomoides rotata]